MSRLQPDEERLLVERAQQGDRVALGRLLAAHYRPLARVLLGYGCRASDVDDLVQETFARALRAMQRFENRGALGAWLRRIAVNLLRDGARRRREVPEEPDRLEMLREPQAPAPEDAASAFPSVLDLLHLLPPEQRYVLVLRFVEDRSLEDIARITRAPVGTVKSRIHYGLRRLRLLLEQARGAPLQAGAEAKGEGR